jgi:hypothetical protein
MHSRGEPLTVYVEILDDSGNPHEVNITDIEWHP